MSNLCHEILQLQTPSTFNPDGSYDEIGNDISCNLGSMNIALTMDGGNIGETVDTAVRALSLVSEHSNIESVPSIRKGNAESHSIGLGQMNLHGFLAREKIHYDSPEALEFADAYFAAIAYYSTLTSNKIAIEKGETFVGFENTRYADGTFFDMYTEKNFHPESQRIKDLFSKFKITLPTTEDWAALKASVIEHGIYNRYLRAVPPTGSISYINNSTASIHPITDRIEIRKEGKTGRVYFPQPFLTNENIEYFKDAYEIGPEALIEMYAVATRHTDQGLSMTVFLKEGATTRDINKIQLLAHKKKIKTIYYIRMRNTDVTAKKISQVSSSTRIEEPQDDTCVACTL